MFHNYGMVSEQVNIKVGKVNGFEQGSILVDIHEYDHPIPCCILLMNKKDIPSFEIGDDVLVIFDSVDLRGYILGIIHTPADLQNKIHEIQNEKYDQVEFDLQEKSKSMNVNGKTIVIEADDELHLKCGKSSVLMKKNGKIIIRGTDLVSRSSGTNKIKGASVDIN